MIRSVGDSAGWQFLPLKLVDVHDRTSDEGTTVTPFSVGPAGAVTGVTYSASYSAPGFPSVAGLPSGLSINASTGVISGGFGYDSAGDYTVTVTESRTGDPSTSVTFLWTVNPANRAPQVTNDSYSTDEDVQLVVDAPGVLSNDEDLDGDDFVANLEVTPSSGHLNLQQDGSFTYTPEDNFSGEVTFHYKAHDGTADTEAIVTILVNALNDAPVASDSNVSVDEDGTLAAALSATDVDSPSSSLTYVLVDDAAHGSVTVAANGSYSYEPAPDYNGPDSFTFQANDGDLDSNVATVTITVNAVNDAPVAVAANASIDEDVTLQGTLTATDVDSPSSSLTYVLVDDAAHGSVTVAANGSYSYEPAPDYSGGDSFTFQANDGDLDSNVATVTITVNPLADAPVASDGTASVDEDGTLPGTLVATDIDSTVLTYAVVTDPTHGTVVIGANGSYTYEPEDDYNGPDSFTFMATDAGDLDSNVATVTITVNPLPDAPVASDSNVSVDEDGTLPATLPATDVDSTVLTYAVVTGPTHGTVVIGANGSYTYEPEDDYNGPDSFTFMATDAGDLDSNVATVTITVNAVNDAPVATGGTASVDEDGTLPGTLVATDIDSTVLTYAVVTGPAHGTVVLGANGSYTYEPEADYVGGDSFTFHANDGDLDSNVATVTITVNPLADVPVASDGTVSVDEDGTLTATLPAAFDPDSSETPLTYALATGVAHGAVTVATDGSYVYTPSPNYYGPDSFTYTANVGTLTSSPATITITVTGVNDAPSFTAATVPEGNEDSGSQSVAWASGMDAGPQESQTLTFVVTNNDNPALFATLPTVSPDGTLTYTPAPNASGNAIVRVVLNDGGGTANGGVETSDPVIFTIAVTAANDAPSFTKGADSTVLEDSGAQTVAGWASDFSAGPADEAGQTLAFLVSNTNNALFAVQPTLATDGTLSYTPAANAFGSATVTVSLQDNGGTANGGVDTSAQQFTITVTGVNDEPSFTAGTVPSVNEDSGPHSVAWATAITAGPMESAQTLSFVVTNNNSALFAMQPAVNSTTGTLTYTLAANASGNATVTVLLQDNGGTANGGDDTSATVTFTIAVTAVNDPPVAANNAYTTVERSVLNVPAPGVLGNDTDADHSTLTAELISGPSHGTLALNSDGSFAYTSAVGFSGTDTFTYVAKDGAEAYSAPATVTLTVTASNLPPVCSATVSPALLWPPNHKKVYVTLSGITDPEGGALTIHFTSILQDEPTNGPGQGNTMQDGGIEANGTKAWVRAERSGTGDGRVYLISYTATDPAGASCTGQVTVGVPHDQSGAPPVLSPGRWNSLTGELVTPPPAPVAVNDSATVAKGDDKDIAVLANDIAHGMPLTVTIVTHPVKGTVRVNSNGTINYDAPSNWTGTTSFTYRVSNGFSTSAPATVTVVVTNGSDDDDDCGDRNHDHGRDNDGRDRDHRRGDHDRCKHGDRDDDDHGDDRDGDCGDRNHDHGRDSDGRDRDHKRGDHDRCKHGDNDRDNNDRDKNDRDKNDRDDNDRDDDDRDGNDRDDNDCGDRNHDHGRDNDNRDRDHRRGDHDRCNHRR